MNSKLKKKLILNVPYAVLGLFATNLGEAWRLATGTNASEKLQSLILDGCFKEAFSNILPSIQPLDLCVGATVAGALRMAVYLKGKNVYGLTVYVNESCLLGEPMRTLHPTSTRYSRTTSSSHNRNDSR